MINRRARLLAIYPDLQNQLADPKWDDALMGAARRFDGCLPVYSWAAARAIDVEDLPSLLKGAGSRYLLLHSGKSWRDLWKVVTRLNLNRWDQLDRAVIGFTDSGGHASLIYSQPLVVEMLMRGQMVSEDNVDNMYAAILFVENQLISANFGPGTCWFLDPV